MRLKLTKTCRRIWRSTLCIPVICFQLASGVSAQDLPELPGGVAASGNSTSARSFGGAQVQGSGSLSNSFQSSDTLSILFSFSPESQHVGAAGNVYVVAIAGGAPYSMLESGEWQLFDGTVTGLKVVSSYDSLGV